jgi:hypothetical protein
MPVTPFHFGPGAAIHSLAPKRVSFLAFCVSNVLIDIEPLYFMLTKQFPLHRQDLRVMPVAVGAMIGAYSHMRWIA